MAAPTFRIGTRGSPLALAQADIVRGLIDERAPGAATEIVVIETEGDADRTSPLESFGGRGAFVKSIENALLRGEIDAAVHSLKDLPTGLPPGLVLGAAPVRENPRDAIVCAVEDDFESLTSGSVIGSGSVRRVAQLSKVYPRFNFTGIRGNVETRLKKVDRGDCQAVVLAVAGLVRLGLESRITRRLEPELVVPAPCQGAIGIECREDDGETRALLERIDDRGVRQCVEAERCFIAALGMGCHAPVGALAESTDGTVSLRWFVGDPKTGAFLRGVFDAGDDGETGIGALAAAILKRLA